MHRLVVVTVSVVLVGCDPVAEEAGGDPCLESVDCRYYGRCATVGSQCVPAREAHCAASLVNCGQHGRCGFTDGECVAVSDEVCRQTSDCTEYGLCNLSLDGYACVARYLKDCKESAVCKIYNSCWPKNGGCKNYQDGDGARWEARAEADEASSGEAP